MTLIGGDLWLTDEHVAFIRQGCSFPPASHDYPNGPFVTSIFMQIARKKRRAMGID